MNQAPHVAIVGATGAVGVEILSCLETRNFPVGSLKLLASARSAGKQVAFRGEMLTVEELTEKSFDGVDIALFSAGGGISLKFAPIAAAAGCVVIDNSSAFRQDPDVPLVVPEINPEAAFNHPRNIIANPNCTTIITLMALFPLHQRFGLKTVIASSYQAVSGSGQHGRSLPNAASCRRTAGGSAAPVLVPVAVIESARYQRHPGAPPRSLALRVRRLSLIMNAHRVNSMSITFIWNEN